MLQSQIPAATPPCILGQYYSSSSWDPDYEERKDWSNGGLNGASGRGGPVTVTKGKNRNKRGHVNGFKLGPAVWATVVARKVDGGGFVPRLSYVSVKGVQYYTDTHIVLYEQPQYGRGHLSCRMWSSAHLAKQACLRSTTKPKWVVVAMADQRTAYDINTVGIGFRKGSKAPTHISECT